jgi:pyruvate formate lyase activating enzyme
MISAEGAAGPPNGTVFSIERYAVHDGGGIRTLVYLKGCPLRCLWCANPEGQEVRPQVFAFPERCIGCGSCETVCPHGAGRRAGPHPPPACAGCGRCAEACSANARRLFGRQMSVAEVVEVVLKDRAFYRKSGGGITLSGGEPTAQAPFAHALLAACRQRGLDTAMETCGHVSFPLLAGLAEHLDLILYDLKHMDRETHRQLTGVPNDLILDNLRQLGVMGVPVLVRVPVIPGYNDTPANLLATAAFVARVPSVRAVELLAYHDYGTGKYAHCGRVYPLPNLPLPNRERLRALAAVIESEGVPCRVG